MEAADRARDGLAVLLPELRRRVGLSQQRLADAMGCSLPTVQRLEAGTAPSTLQRLFEVADALEMTGAELVALVEGLEGLGAGAPPVDEWLEGLAWAPSETRPFRRPLLADEDGSRASGTQPGGVDPPPDTSPERHARRRQRIFGQLLSELSPRAGMSRADLAGEWGFSPSTLKRFAMGSASPDLQELESLGDLLGLTRVELVGLVEELSAFLDGESIPRKRRLEVTDKIAAWFDEQGRWVPNPGVGRLSARPAGLRLGLMQASRSAVLIAAEPEGPRYGAVRAVGAEGSEGPTKDSPQPQLHRLVVEPAAAGLVEPILHGWGAVAARVPRITDGSSDVVGLMTDEIVGQLARVGFRAWPALLIRPARSNSTGRIVRAHAATGRGGQVSEVSADRALYELAQGGPDGEPWRLVVTDGLATAEAAGLRGRQPSPHLFGAALAVIDSDLSLRRSELNSLTARRLDAEVTWVQAMDAGVFPALRFRGIPDPVAGRRKRGFGGWARYDGPSFVDDRRLEALVEAGALRRGVRSLVHVANQDQVEWVLQWLAARGGDGTELISVVQRSASRARIEPPLDELVLLAAEPPSTLVKQVDAALRLADVEAGLDVWELEAPGRSEARKRRGGLIGALAAIGSKAVDLGDGRWSSPGGRCTFEWTP